MKDGGPAFPSKNAMTIGDVSTSGHTGMTLRDYFAAKAMQGLLTRGLVQQSDFEAGDNRTIKEAISEWAYVYADAMLKARGE